MKPDAELTVEEWRKLYYECWKHKESANEFRESVIRRIQRAAFEKGAKAQREASGGDGFCLVKCPVCQSDIRTTIPNAPLVKFEEEE